MITLHNLQGNAVALNGMQIERVEGGPETHVTLVNGTSYIVMESLEEVVRLHREDRAAVQALADFLGVPEGTGSPAAGTEPRDALLRLVAPAPSEDEGARP